MLPWLRSQRRYRVGLDINPDEIRLLQLKPTRKGWAVTNYALLALPKDAIVDGKIKQFTAVRTAIQQVVHMTGTAGCATAIALPAGSVISQQIKLISGLSDMECEAEIATNLGRYLPGVKDELCFDFESVTNAATDSQEVLLVASRLEQLNSYVELVNTAHLPVKVVEVDSYALMRAAKFILGINSLNEIVALVDVSPTVTQFIVFRRENIIFSQYWYNENLTSLPATVKRAVQFYLSSQQHLRIDQVLLSGTMITATALIQDYFQQELALVTHIANPFQAMSLAAVNEQELQPVAARFQICCGLAIGGVNYARY